MLAECKSRGEYERSLDDLEDRLLDRDPRIHESGLFRGLIIEQGFDDGDSDVRVVAAKGVKASGERIAAALAAYRWSEKSDLRAAVQQNVTPALDQRKSWWLRHFDKRFESDTDPTEPPQTVGRKGLVEGSPEAWCG